MLNNIPDSIFADGIVFMAQAVSGRSDIRPWLVRNQNEGVFPQFGSGFADRPEAALGVIRLPVFLKGRQVQVGSVKENRTRVVYDILQTLNGEAGHMKRSTLARRFPSSSDSP